MTTRRMMILGLSAGALGLSACAGPRGRGPGPRGGGPGGGMMQMNSISRGMTLKAEGQYEEALPYFAQVAGMGRDYEVAQFHLGDCLMRIGETQEDPREEENQKREGLFWIRFAAISGYVGAQARLARASLEGEGCPVNRVEAALYLALAEDNPRSEFSSNFALDDIAVVRRALSDEEIAAGRVAAAEFTPVRQTFRTTPQMERGGPGGGGGGRPPGGGGGGPGGGGGGGRGGY